MEERKTIFDYLGQVFMIYGISMTIMCIFGIWFGEEAQDISKMFSLGQEGLSIEIMIQFLAISFLVVSFQFLFFSEHIIKKMSVIARTIWMVISIIFVIVVFILMFDWFPADMWEPWAMFLLCFGVCFLISISVMVIKERMENKKMEEALERLKRKEEER